MQDCFIRPYHWESKDLYERGKGRNFTFLVWGYNEKQEEVCWRIENYYPHLYLRFSKTPDEYLQENIHSMMNSLEKDLILMAKSTRSKQFESLKYETNFIKSFSIEKKTPLFYYKQGEEHLLVKVKMKLSKMLDFVAHMVKTKCKNGEIEVFESGGSDRVPCENKYCVEKGLELSEWMKCKAVPVYVNKMTKLPKEYIVDCDLVKKSDEDFGIPEVSVLSFDIEVYSEVFTMFPSAYNIPDEIYSIGFAYQKGKERQNIILCLYDVEEYGELEKYGDCSYIYVKDEQELILTFFNQIIKLDPTFIITYNGQMFDWDYIEKRCEIFDIKVPNISRMEWIGNSNFRNSRIKGYQLSNPNYPGRLDVDMYIVSRITIFGLKDYKLKTVSYHVLKETKIDLPPKQMFQAYCKKKKTENGWIPKTKEEIRTDMNKIMEYLERDFDLPLKLFNALNIDVYLFENAKVLNCNVRDLFHSGQSIKCIKQLYRCIAEDGRYINKREKPDKGKYVGGYVVKPVAGLYEDVSTYDVSSLYPNAIRLKNICYTTFINEKEDGHKYTDEMCNVIERDIEDKEGNVTHVKLRFIKQEHFKGVVPRLVEHVNALRSEYKKRMNEAYDKAEKFKEEGNMEMYEKFKKIGDGWDIKQKAVKVSANSLYGFMGMKTGAYCFIEGGLATTLTGQEQTKKAIKYSTEEMDAHLVYGDTDSIMVRFPKRQISLKNFKKECHKIAKEITDVFPEEIIWEWENYFLTYYVETPKKYAALKIDRDNPTVFPDEKTIKEKRLIYIKGLCCVRGDSCNILYSIYEEVLTKILLKKPFEEILQTIDDHVIRVFARDFPISDYMFNQRMGESYKSATAKMAIFANNMRKYGITYMPKEEVDYLYIRIEPEPSQKSMKMISPNIFNEGICSLDTFHYLTNVLANPLSSLLTTCFEDNNIPKYARDRISEIKYRSRTQDRKGFYIKNYFKAYLVELHMIKAVLNQEFFQKFIPYMMRYGEEYLNTLK